MAKLYQYVPQPTNFARISVDAQQHVPMPPEFQAQTAFYDVQYPYWQAPYNQGPYTTVGFVHTGSGTLANFGYVGAPLPASDYNTPQITSYGAEED